jgi:type II secretory pathway pseudopilin PulG
MARDIRPTRGTAGPHRAGPHRVGSYHARTRRAGVTLVELVVSITVMAVLMGGIASAIVIATHALPSRESVSAATITASQVAADMVDDLHCATSFVERTATAVEFKVPDRTGDATVETIRYDWSATPGDPLVRTYNGSAREVATNVHDFTLAYDVRTASTTTTQAVTTTSPEVELASFIDWGGIAPMSMLPSPTNWMAEYFTITPPNGVATMNISRIQIMARGNIADPNATMTIGVYKPATAGSPVPQSTPIGTPASTLTSSLGAAFSWADFSFSDVVISTSELEYVLVVSASGLGTALAQYYYWRSAPANPSMFNHTNDGGASWVLRAGVYDQYDMPFRVWGTFETTTTQDVTTSTYFLRSVGIALQVGEQARARVDTAAAVLNEPEVSGI